MILIRKIIIWIAVLLLIISGSIIAYYFYDSYQNNREYQSYKETSTSELLEVNSDYIGWLHIDDIVNLPVVESEDDYYLTHSFSKEENKYGCLFTYNSTGNNLIIHGHNNNNDSMFSLLLRYKDEDFFRSHQEIVFTTKDDEEIRYTVFAVINFDTRNTNEFNPYYSSISDYKISQIIENSLYDTSLSVSEDDTFISLSTCDTSEYGAYGRLLVIGVKE